MTLDEQNWVEWAFKGMVAFLGWLGMSTVKDIRKDVKTLEKDAQTMRDDIVRNYAPRIETNQSLERIHKRIDEGNEKAEENFKETRSDINEVKNLILQQDKHKL